MFPLPLLQTQSPFVTEVTVVAQPPRIPSVLAVVVVIGPVIVKSTVPPMPADKAPNASVPLPVFLIAVATPEPMAIPPLKVSLTVAASVNVPLSVRPLPPNVKEPGPLRLILLTDRVMSLFKAVPAEPAAPKISESPVPGGVLPPDVVQLAAVFQFASVLPTQVSVPAAWPERVESAAATSTLSMLMVFLFMVCRG